MSIAAGVSEKNVTAVQGVKKAPGGAQDLQNHFLTLLVTQLKNQDPTKPLDNSQLTTQLAQINTLAGIEKLNTRLDAVSGQLSTGQLLQGAMLTGRGVMIKGTQILSGKGTATPSGVELGGDATAVTATVTDGSGRVVRTLSLGALKTGVHTFSWDGKRDDGSTAPDGRYSLSINAANSSGQVKAEPLSYALVTGVSTVSNAVRFDLGSAGFAAPGDVRKIF